MCCKQIVLMMMGIRTWIELYQKPPKGYVWSGERPTKNQATTRPENLWSEVWSKMGKAAQKKGKNGRTRRKNSTMLEDREAFISSIWKMVKKKETIKIATRKLEVPMDAAMPCKKGTKKWKLMNPRGGVWNHLYQKIMKITSRRKDTIR